MAGGLPRSRVAVQRAPRAAPPGGAAFVGRERELGELDRGLREAAAAHGRLFLLSGEPGVGKSRLAGALSVRAQERRCRVMWGRCWEGGGAPAYWPWLQVIRAYLREPEAIDVLAGLGPGAGYIAHVFPEVQRLVPDVGPLPLADLEQVRFALFDSVATLLGQAAERQPLVLVFDDLHAADPPSLQMLEFVAGELRAMALLVIGTYRDVGARPTVAVAEALARLAHEAVTIPLRGLAPGDVARLVQDAAGAPVSEALASSLHARTGGNPFFVGELVRLLIAEGRLTEEAAAADAGRAGSVRLPEAIRRTVAQRVGLVSDGCRELLATASVVGREFTLALVERASAVPDGGSLELIGEAIAAGLVEELSATAERYGFSHALVAETLYEVLAAGRRAELHSRVAHTLEGIYAGDLESHLAELAHHFLSAGRELVDRALDYSVRAADHAGAHLAYEEAAAFYERAVGALERSGPSDRAARCELLLSWGDALMKSGQAHAARETLRNAADLARALAAPAQLARAALTLAGPYAEAGFGDELRAPLLEEALQALSVEDSGLRARVLARLAPELYWAHDFKRAAALSADSVAMARRLEDPRTLGEALECRHYAILGPDTLEQRLAINEELVRVAEELRDASLLVRGRLWRIHDLLELGSVSAVEEEIDRHARLAEALRQPGHLWVAGYLRAMRVLVEGRLEEARRLAGDAVAIGRRAQIADVDAVYFGAQLYPICRQQGGAQELEVPFAAIVELYHELIPGWRTLLAGVYVMLGRLEDARREYERLAARDFELPRDHNWLAFHWVMAVDLCPAFDDRQGAEVLYERLRPHAAHHITVAFAANCAGPVDYPLARLATLMARYAEAEAHFEAALAAHERIGARGWAAETRSEYAAMLVARGEPGDAEHARRLLQAATAAAAELGWRRVARRCDELLAGRPVAPATPAEAALRLEGEYWTVCHGGRGFRLRDSKGLRLIALLLARPGVELAAIELVSVLEAQPRTERTAMGEELPLVSEGSGDAGALLDPEAKAAYRERLRALEQELEEATAFNDLERKIRAQEESDFLTAELSRAIGLGGRDRRAASAAERARVNVRNRITGAIDKIAEQDPALGHHLRATIRTGRLCSYQPGPEPLLTWTV
ncbi:MAG: ATP-binding protein [Solirubrobacteraceae bacterium]